MNKHNRNGTLMQSPRTGQRYKPQVLVCYLDHIAKQIVLKIRDNAYENMKDVSDVSISDNIERIRERFLTLCVRNPEYTSNDQLIETLNSQLNTK